mgnify:CR=1 FL=1
MKTSKLSNVILHQFEGLHKLWDTPFKEPLLLAHFKSFRYSDGEQPFCL